MSADGSAVEPATLEAPPSATDRPRVARPIWRSPLVAGVVLLLVYVGLSFALDPGGSLGTDTGGKVATVKVMSERGDLDPDVGYWAAAWDPEAEVHGLYYTSHIGDRYVNVTSLPMVLAARPLYDLGGYRATLLLPMAGAVAAAFAARALSSRLKPASRVKPGDDGWTAFWIVGLASPMAIYALDLWEHSLGVACMAWAAIALFDTVFVRATWWRGALAGVGFGVAAAMRTEAMVYVVTSTALACGVLAFGSRRAIGDAAKVGASAVIGFVVAFGTNLALETVVLGEQLRGGRTSGAATRGLSALDVRIEEGLVTFLSPFPTMEAQGWLAGACLLVALVFVARRSMQPASRAVVVVAATVAGLVLLWRFADGPSFVPGLIAATPFAAAGLAWGFRGDRARFVTLLAVVPVPLVLAFQFTGGAAPQWAGRYLLVTGFLLAVVGISQRDQLAQWARVGFVVASVAVTGLGLVWLAQRSHQIADAGARLQARPESVLISPNGFVPREFGASYGDQDWLSSGSADDLRFAVEVVGAAGRPDFALVDLDVDADPRAFPGWTATSTELVPFIAGVDVRVTTYERS